MKVVGWKETPRLVWEDFKKATSNTGLSRFFGRGDCFAMAFKKWCGVKKDGETGPELGGSSSNSIFIWW